MKAVVLAGLRSISLLVLLSAVSLALTGCTSSDPENQAYRPWGAPQGQWGTGLPSSMTEGR